jgi:hypothetical protein
MVALDHEIGNDSADVGTRGRVMEYRRGVLSASTLLSIPRG